METTPKRAHLEEEPVKQGFNFNSCPNELKLQILSKVDPDSALKLLRINRFTRNYVLENRSYPESIEIDVAERVSFLSIKFKGSNAEQTEPVAIDSARFSRVHSTDLLVMWEICEHSFEYSGRTMPRTRLSHTFPNLKFIAKLRTDLGFNVVMETFEHSRAQIIDGVIGRMKDLDEKSFIAFTRDHLKLCKRIGNFPHSLAIWNLLKTMCFEHITFYVHDDQSFEVVDVLRRVLEEGRVPSRAVTAELQYDVLKYIGEPEDGFQKDLMKIVSEMLRKGPMERLRDPPAQWANHDDDSCNWQFRGALAAQHELCVWVNCESDILKLHIMQRPIAK